MVEDLDVKEKLSLTLIHNKMEAFAVLNFEFILNTFYNWDCLMELTQMSSVCFLFAWFD
jgi:hypothetical protein